MDEKIMKNVDKDKLMEWLGSTSGYDILAPGFFLEMGFPEEFVRRYTFNHQGGEGKHAITSYDGQENAAFGVSEFAIVIGIATAVGAEPAARHYFGRGKNFRADVARTYKALKS